MPIFSIWCRSRWLTIPGGCIAAGTKSSLNPIKNSTLMSFKRVLSMSPTMIWCFFGGTNPTSPSAIPADRICSNSSSDTTSFPRSSIISSKRFITTLYTFLYSLARSVSPSSSKIRLCSSILSYTFCCTRKSYNARTNFSTGFFPPRSSRKKSWIQFVTFSRISLISSSG